METCHSCQLSPGLIFDVNPGVIDLCSWLHVVWKELCVYLGAKCIGESGKFSAEFYGMLENVNICTREILGTVSMTFIIERK